MKIGKYILLVVIVLCLAFCIGEFRRGGEIAIVEGFNTWWTGVYERYEARKSPDNDAENPSETDKNAETTDEDQSSDEEVPEKQPPVIGDEPFVENKDGSVSMCSYEFLRWAQKNAQYNEESACGPFNVPHEDEKVFPVRFFDCENLDTMNHDHADEKVKMMINLNKVSVFCCDDEKADHDTGVWDLPSAFCVGFDNVRIDTCKTCEGVLNVDKVVGAIKEMELTTEEWKAIEKVACYWWETDEESGEKVRVFGLNFCGCDEPEEDEPVTPDVPGGPGGGGGDDLKPDPKPEHNPQVDPEEPEVGNPEHNPQVGPVEGEPEVGVGDPVEQPAPNEPPAVVVQDPVTVTVPEAQPPVGNPEHNDTAAPVEQSAPVAEAQPAPAPEAPAVSVEAPAVPAAPAPEAPAVSVEAPAAPAAPAPEAPTVVEAKSISELLG